MTNVSVTDLHVFANLANPQKANVNKVEENGVLSDTSDDDRDESDVSDASGAKGVRVTRASAKLSSESQTHDRSDACSESESCASRRTSSSRSTSIESSPSETVQQTNDTSTSNYTPTYFDRTPSETMPNVASSPSHGTSQELELLDKQQVLMDMERLKLQGIQMTKRWTIDDRLDDMQFEVRRHMLHIDERSNIKMMRDSMRVMCYGVESITTVTGLMDLDGWSLEVCRDLEKYDSAFGRIYRKYWGSSLTNNPEFEIAFGIIGSMAMFHFKKKISKKIMPRSNGPTFNVPTSSASTKMRMPMPSSYSDIDSDDECPPP